MKYLLLVIDSHDNRQYHGPFNTSEEGMDYGKKKFSPEISDQWHWYGTLPLNAPDAK